ncbi:MAG: hypothetical protein HZA48_12120 [Planctomycetes bacterium]|nr:hypothetical protein [Planctomycetota bacterium]
MSLNKEQLQQCWLAARKIFKAKGKSRKLWAKKPIEVKIKELIQLQKAMVKANPEFRNSRIIPWKI